MDGIGIPDDQIIPFEDIATGVRGLRIAFVNTFGVTHPDGSWSLIDAALPFTASRIRNWAEETFGRPPNSLMLTHGHFDHVSAAKELAEGWSIPIYAHPLEFPYLTGKQEYAKPNVGAGGGLMPLLSPLFPRGPIDLGERLRALPSVSLGGEAMADLPELPGWQILHTPGHTPGHVSFFRLSDRTLLVGDAFCTTKPESFFESSLLQQPELHGPPAYFTSNWDAARGSVERLAELCPNILAPGHGKALAGAEIAEALRQLAANFDLVAIPENRR